MYMWYMLDILWYNYAFTYIILVSDNTSWKLKYYMVVSHIYMVLKLSKDYWLMPSVVASLQCTIVTCYVAHFRC